jgi:L-fuculose-phosphate aldolase
MSLLRKLLEGSAALPLLNSVLPFVRRLPDTEDQLRQELAQYARMLHGQGFVAACDGNLSVRMNPGRIMVTPTGFSKGALQPDDMVVVDAQGNKISGLHNPSSEIAMHLTIYRMRPDVEAVVHAHPSTATGFASAGIALDQPLCSEIVITLGSVPLARYATPGSAELSQSLEPLIPGHDAILMANHGVVTYGPDLRQAYMRMEAVEHYAKVVLTARQLGCTRSLDSTELEKLSALRSRYRENGR